MKKEYNLLEPDFIVDKTGKKTQVVLDIKAYDQLLEYIEDLALGKMAEEILATESKEEYIDFEDLRDSLIKNSNE